MKNAIILAAGKSARMNSNTVKLLHNLIDKPIIKYVTESATKAGATDIVVVVGHQSDKVKETLGEGFTYEYQLEQLGTAHAVSCAKSLKGKKGQTLILMGDCPLISPKTLENLYESNKNFDLTVLTTQLKNPGTYGRIIRNRQNRIVKIAEHFECSEHEKAITEINTGIYCIKNEVLFKFLPYISNNNEKGEYLFTSIIEILTKNNHKVQALVSADNSQFLGVNDRIQLDEVLRIMQHSINKNHCLNGVTIMDMNSVYIGSNVTIGKDVTIYPNNFITNNSVIKDNSIIMPNCWLQNAIIGENCTINYSTVTDSEILNNTTIGPFARIRNNSVVGENSKIGNFVELKNTKTKTNFKSSHLSYLGDCEVGSSVNFGCGAVTVNFDGNKKHVTKILDNAFIGCNVNLIAPITIGKNTLVAAGSTLTQNLPDGGMAIARSYQTNKEGYGERFFKKNNNEKNNNVKTPNIKENKTNNNDIKPPRVKVNEINKNDLLKDDNNLLKDNSTTLKNINEQLHESNVSLDNDNASLEDGFE